MLKAETLLLPIPGDNPAGTNLQYSALFKKIEEARREEDPELKARIGGDGKANAKKANFELVIELAAEGLAKESKDLWLAVWLCDALIRQEKLAGLRTGLELLYGLIENYWDGLHPLMENGDPWPRLAALNWLGEYSNAAKGSSPVLALDQLRVSDLSKEQVRNDVAKLKPEERKAFYSAMLQDVKASLLCLANIDKTCLARFAEEPPNFAVLEGKLESIGTAVQALFEAERKTNPDHPDPKPVVPGKTGSPPTGTAPSPISFDAGLPLSEEITSTGEAIRHITSACRYLQHANPASPIPYLLIRALRWGELRGAPEGQLNELLEPPATELRMAVKQYAQAGNWERLLDTTEAVMCTGCGRGWLDLQRYSIAACKNLGFEAAAKALHSELKQLLGDIPQLAAATLLDDTGAANPDTAVWLRKEGLIS
jgi:type VI secretion system protein ImpA